MKCDGERPGNEAVHTLQKRLEDLCQAQEELQKNEAMYRFLADNSPDGIWRLDEQFCFVYVSPAVFNIIGFRPEELIGRHLFSILTPESVEQVIRGFASRKPLLTAGQRWENSTYTVEAVKKDGKHIWVEVAVSPIFDKENHLLGYSGITRDISERLRQEDAIRQYAFLDPLTNLPNRRAFEDVLQSVICEHQSLERPFAVMFFDVDGLKQINDTYGHSAGDALLKAVADRICQTVRKQDFVARLAGDEFMAILPGLGDSSAVNLIATRLLRSFHQTIVMGANKAKISVSMGISFFPADAGTVNELINYADKAMYQAKRNGGSRFVCYGQL